MITSKLLAIMAYAALCFWSPAAAQSIVIGAKEFTEQLLVAEMTAQLLRASGLSPHKGTGFATTGVRTLQERGIVDLYWEYTGTSLTTFNHVSEKLSPDEAYARVKTLDAERGLVWLAPSKVDNSYALAMRRAHAATKGISSISDLARRVQAGDVVRLASTVEFPPSPNRSGGAGTAGAAMAGADTGGAAAVGAGAAARWQRASSRAG
jgi:osmoprotectant transport system substrate-binding protein